MIRIIPSCVLTENMLWTYGAEIRRFWNDDGAVRFRAVKKSIDSGGYVIFNQCIDNNSSTDFHFPTEIEWRNRIEDDVRRLWSLGARKNNCRMTIVNEPTKYLRKEYGRNGVNDLIWLINIAHDQIAGRFDLGAGNMEFYDSAVLGDWYGQVASRGRMEYLDIHIQNSCDTEANTAKYTNYAHNLAVTYHKRVDCTESNSTEWDVSTGDFNKLLMQLRYAEKIGCENFAIVFINLDTPAFPGYNGRWNKICFKINGVARAKTNLARLEIMSIAKAPKPNIIKETRDGMILETLFDKKFDGNKGPYRTSGYLVEWVQMILNLIKDIDDNPFYDGDVTGRYDILTKQAVIDFQSYLDTKGYPNIDTDGKTGRKLYGWAVEELMLIDLAEGRKFDRLLSKWASPYKK